MNPIQTFSNRDLTSLYESFAHFVKTNHLSALESETVIVPNYFVAAGLKNKTAQINGIYSATECFLTQTFLGRLFRKLNSKDFQPIGNSQISWVLFNAALNSGDSEIFAPIRHLIPPNGTESQLLNLCVHLAHLLSDYELYRTNELAEILDRSPSHFINHFWQQEIHFRKTQGYFGVFEMWEYFFKQMSDDTFFANNPGKSFQRLILFGFKHLPPAFVEIIKSLARFVPVFSFELDQFPIFATESKTKGQVGNSTTLLGNLGRFNGKERIWGNTFDHKPVIRSTDATLQIHICESVQREIEILKNTLLHELSLNEQLNPQDITVVVPEIEVYEQSIRALFGPASEHPLPFTLSPQINRDAERFCRFIERTLLLAEANVSASHLADFLSFPPFAKWCSISENEQTALLDFASSHHFFWEPKGGTSSTFDKELQRSLLGYALEPKGSQSFQGLVPLEHGESTLKQMIQLKNVLIALGLLKKIVSGEKTFSKWLTSTHQIMAILLQRYSNNERFLAWLKVFKALGLFSNACDSSKTFFAAPFSRMLIQYLNEENTSLKFSSRRGILFTNEPFGLDEPSKLVCVLGIKEENTNKVEPPSSFDIFGLGKRPTDRTPQLRAIQHLSNFFHLAQDKLILMAQTPRNLGQRLPPLLNDLVAFIRTNLNFEYSSVEEAILYLHPAKGSDPINFSTDLKRKCPNYSQADFERASACLGQTLGRPVGLDREHEFAFQLQTKAAGAIPLIKKEFVFIHHDQFINALVSPIRFFLRDRLGIENYFKDSPFDHQGPFLSNRLEVYRLQKEIIEKLRGSTDEAILPATANMTQNAHPLKQAEARCLASECKNYWHHFISEFPENSFEKWKNIPYFLNLDSLLISGTLPNVGESGLIDFRPTQIKPKDFIRLWTLHLIASVLWQKGQLHLDHVKTIGVFEDQIICFSETPEAQRLLIDLKKGFTQASTSLIPFFAKSGFSYSKELWSKSHSPHDAMEYALKEFEGSDFSPGERLDAVNGCFIETEFFEDSHFRKQFEEYAELLFQPIFAAVKTIKIDLNQ